MTRHREAEEQSPERRTTGAHPRDRQVIHTDSRTRNRPRDRQVIHTDSRARNRTRHRQVIHTDSRARDRSRNRRTVIPNKRKRERSPEDIRQHPPREHRWTNKCDRFNCSERIRQQAKGNKRRHGSDRKSSAPGHWSEKDQANEPSRESTVSARKVTAKNKSKELKVTAPNKPTRANSASPRDSPSPSDSSSDSAREDGTVLRACAD